MYGAFIQKNKKASERERKVKALVLFHKNTELLYYSHFVSGLKNKAKIGSLQRIIEQ